MAAKEEKSPGVTPRGMLLLKAQELTFVKALAGNSKELRDKALRRLKKWFKARSQGTFLFTEEDLMRLWKGMFYSMWMSDKPLIQEELAESISELVHSFSQPKQSFLFMKCFFLTMALEWVGLDQLRLNKFLMLVRRFLRQCLMVVRNLGWTNKNVKKMNSALRWSVLSPEGHVPYGLRSHFFEIYLEELAKVGGEQIPENMVTLLLTPFVRLVTDQKEFMNRGILTKCILHQLIDQHDVAFEYRDRFNAWKAAGYPGEGPDDMQKVEESDEDEEQSGDEDEEQSEDEDKDSEEDNREEQEGHDGTGEEKKKKPGGRMIKDHVMLHGTHVSGTFAALDPRAGNVNVALPQIPFNPFGMVNLLGREAEKANGKIRRYLKKQAGFFTTLAEGRYPFTNRYYAKEAVQKKKIIENLKDEDTHLWKAVSRLEHFEKNLEDSDRKVDLPKTSAQMKLEKIEQWKKRREVKKLKKEEEAFGKFVEEYAAKPKKSKTGESEEERPTETDKGTDGKKNRSKKRKLSVNENNEDEFKVKNKPVKSKKAKLQETDEDETGSLEATSQQKKRKKRVQKDQKMGAAIPNGDSKECGLKVSKRQRGGDAASSKKQRKIDHRTMPDDNLNSSDLEDEEVVISRKKIQLKEKDLSKVSVASMKDGSSGKRKMTAEVRTPVGLDTSIKSLGGKWEVMPLSEVLARDLLAKRALKCAGQMLPTETGAWEVSPAVHSTDTSIWVVSSVEKPVLRAPVNRTPAGIGTWEILPSPNVWDSSSRAETELPDGSTLTKPKGGDRAFEELEFEVVSAKESSTCDSTTRDVPPTKAASATEVGESSGSDQDEVDESSESDQDSWTAPRKPCDSLIQVRLSSLPSSPPKINRSDLRLASIIQLLSLKASEYQWEGSPMDSEPSLKGPRVSSRPLNKKIFVPRTARLSKIINNVETLQRPSDLAIDTDSKENESESSMSHEDSHTSSDSFSFYLPPSPGSNAEVSPNKLVEDNTNSSTESEREISPPKAVTVSPTLNANATVSLDTTLVESPVKSTVSSVEESPVKLHTGTLVDTSPSGRPASTEGNADISQNETEEKSASAIPLLSSQTKVGAATKSHEVLMDKTPSKSPPGSPVSTKKSPGVVDGETPSKKASQSSLITEILTDKSPFLVMDDSSLNVSDVCLSSVKSKLGSIDGEHSKSSSLDSRTTLSPIKQGTATVELSPLSTVNVTSASQVALISHESTLSAGEEDSPVARSENQSEEGTPVSLSTKKTTRVMSPAQEAESSDSVAASSPQQRLVASPLPVSITTCKTASSDRMETGSDTDVAASQKSGDQTTEERSYGWNLRSRVAKAAARDIKVDKTEMAKKGEDVAKDDSGMDVAEEESGLDVAKEESGLNVAEEESGTDISKENQGTDVTKNESETDISKEDGQADVEEQRGSEVTQDTREGEGEGKDKSDPSAPVNGAASTVIEYEEDSTCLTGITKLLLKKELSRRSMNDESSSEDEWEPPTKQSKEKVDEGAKKVLDEASSLLLGNTEDVDDNSSNGDEETHEIVLRNNKRVRSSLSIYKSSSSSLNKTRLQSQLDVKVPDSPKRSLRLAQKQQNETTTEQMPVKMPARGKTKTDAQVRQFTGSENKRVGINLCGNSSHSVGEYHRTLMANPSVPFSAERRPTRSALRNRSETSPVNPFYPLKKIVKKNVFL